MHFFQMRMNNLHIRRKNLSTYPGTARDTHELNDTYRTIQLISVVLTDKIKHRKNK